MPYGAAWRDGRKLFQREFHAKAVQAYRPTELQQTHALLRRLLHTPGELTKHIKQYVSAAGSKLCLDHWMMTHLVCVGLHVPK